jgi:hypothetical protein
MSDEKIIWSQLKYAYNAINKQPIKVYKNKFTIGRSLSMTVWPEALGNKMIHFFFCCIFVYYQDCDLIFTDNKLLSQEHAYIERDAENRVWFVDTSKNGSLINLNTKIHNTVEC